MHRYTTALGTLLALIFVSAPGLAQESSGPKGPSGAVGSAPGEEDDETDASASPEDDSSDNGGSEEESGAESMEGSRDGWDSTDTDEQTQTTSEHPSTENLLVLAPHAGVTFPAFDDLGFWGSFGLEVGFLPVMKQLNDRPLEVAVVARYSQPGATGNGSDTNLGPTGGAYNW
ncbi:MAG: hypothetical protein ABEN55_23270, partial [Bradymonadaceae bacterium]